MKYFILLPFLVLLFAGCGQSDNPYNNNVLTNDETIQEKGDTTETVEKTPISSMQQQTKPLSTKASDSGR